MNARTLITALLTALLVMACGRPDTAPPPPSPPAVDIEMIPIAAGTFTMGAPPVEPGREPEETQHVVTITRRFSLGKTEVTRGQWQAVSGETGRAFAQCGIDCPIASVSWLEAVTFCNALSKREGLSSCYTIEDTQVEWNHDCAGYRLPTEAEWEFAARAGESSGLPGGELTTQKCRIDPLLDAVGWYCGNSRVTYPDCFDAREKWGGAACAGPHPVAQKRPNAWGLFDMNGNAWEWVWDRHAPYPETATTDPIGPSTGEFRVLRGGSWLRNARFCRNAARNKYSPDQKHYHGLGFRVARSHVEK